MDTILSRIKKLIALTVERGATPDEAAQATAKAQALLFEHNLSMAQVEAHAIDDKGESYDKTLYQMTEGKEGSLGWRKALLNLVARYNFCKAIASINGDLRHIAIIGKISNVAVVLYLYEHVQREIHHLAKVYQCLQIENRSQHYTSFCMGAISTIHERLKAQRACDEAASNASTALVVQTDAHLNQAVTKYFPHLIKSRGIRTQRADGFAAGRKAGRSIPLNRGVTTSAGQRRLS